MFVAVGLWNSWFSAQLYMRNEKLYPLQLIIRNYVVRSAKPADMQNMEGLRDAGIKGLLMNSPLLVREITIIFQNGNSIIRAIITKTLNLSNNLLALILPGSVSVFNFIVIRIFTPVSFR